MRTLALVLLFFTIPLSARAQKPVVTADSRLHYRLGWENFRHEDWEGALTEFRKSVEIDPVFALGHYGVGRALMGLKRYTEAIGAYARCRDLYLAENGKLFSNQLDAQQLRKDSIDQIREQIRLYSTAPQTPQTVESLRQLQLQLHVVEQNQDLGKNISLEVAIPPFVLLALGSAYFRAERFLDAEREYRNALATKPDYGEAHNNLAIVYLYMRRPAEALNHLLQAEKAGYLVNPQLKDDVWEAARK